MGSCIVNTYIKIRLYHTPIRKQELRRSCRAYWIGSSPISRYSFLSTFKPFDKLATVLCRIETFSPLAEIIISTPPYLRAFTAFSITITCKRHYSLMHICEPDKILVYHWARLSVERDPCARDKLFWNK